MADWLAIKTEYCSTNISYRKIADKYGVSFNTLKDRAIREGWKEQRDTTHNKIATTTQQKIVVKVSAHEADRLSRILALNDALLSKAERGVSELGEFYIVKRKVSSHQAVKDENGEVEGVADVDETTEVAVKGKTIVSSLTLKQFASALKDLNDVAKVSDPGKDESLTKARELLEGLPSAID